MQQTEQLFAGVLLLLLTKPQNHQSSEICTLRFIEMPIKSGKSVLLSKFIFLHIYAMCMSGVLIIQHLQYDRSIQIQNALNYHLFSRHLTCQKKGVYHMHIYTCSNGVGGWLSTCLPFRFIKSIQRRKQNVMRQNCSTPREL